jgi:subtilisin family serine protease
MTVWTVAVPAQGDTARAGEASFTPSADEWWFATWKILSQVWPLTQGAGVTVAVLDSGVQASAADLRGAVVSGGDVTGNHTNGEQDFNSVGDGHGTQMAVLIAGQGRGTGIVGIAPEAKILPVAVTAGAVDLSASPGNVAAGIIYAVNHGADVIDISQVYPSVSATGCDPVEQAAVAYALSRGIVIVAAEGASNLIGDHPSEPASCAGVLAVGAIQRNRAVWRDDVEEPYVMLVAPGAGVVSSGRDGELVSENGARSAAALVAGVVALIRSRYPSMPWYQVIQRLIGTALPEGGFTPNESSGFGIVRLSEVVNATAFPVAASTPDPVYVKYAAWLATPQGRAVSRQIAESMSMPPARTSGAAKAQPQSATRILLFATIAGAVLLVVATVAVLLMDAKRRRRVAAPPASFGSGVLPPDSRSRDDLAPRIFFGEDSGEQAFRVPPYSPAPDPPEA